MEEEEDFFKVVINEEEQYSIWPSFKSIPPGWRFAGVEGEKEKCLDYIEKNWTDMRPLSLRKKMDEIEMEAPLREELLEEEPSVSSIITYLTKEKKEHKISLLPYISNQKILEDSLRNKWLYITFPETQGGTCIGIEINKFELINSILTFEATTTLDFTKLRIVADISIKQFEGTGKVEAFE